MESNRPPHVYFALAFGLSWLFWVPAALMGKSMLTFPYALLLFFGGVGPALAAIILLAANRYPTARQDYFERLVRFRQIPIGFQAVIWLTWPAIDLLSVVIAWLVNGELPAFSAARQCLSAPLGLIPFALSVFLFGPLPEELGWRGYALDALQSHWNALIASLILGVAWTVWHLPLFFMQSTYQHGLGFATPAFWSFALSLCASSVLYTWIYNNTRCSTLSAVLFHFMTNFSGELFLLSPTARLYQAALVAAAALGVIAFFGPTRLKREAIGDC
jgi:uncharacterized protein